MNYLGLSEEELRASGAWHTAKEISQQPLLWHHLLEKILNDIGEINSFLESAISECDNIIFTGAGTSAFIGLSLHGLYFRRFSMLTRAIPTTDMVSNPEDYFNKKKSPLIISFARSGNSPESYAALELADTYSKKCFHLIITCDASGRLASYQSDNQVLVFVLPQQANDRSLAMTSSYSGMLLTGILMAHLSEPDYCKRQVGLLEQYAHKVLDEFSPILKEIAGKDFKRAVFLGSGALLGTATEAHLKLQELTNGKIICIADSYLGFRHGPKAAVDETTLVMYFLSNHPYVVLYENDLVRSMKKGNTLLLEISVQEDHQEVPSGIGFSFSGEGNQLDGAFLPVCSIMPAQILAFYKSLQLGLMPDNPSVNGAISRVVEGVTIYPMRIPK